MAQPTVVGQNQTANGTNVARQPVSEKAIADDVASTVESSAVAGDSRPGDVAPNTSVSGAASISGGAAASGRKASSRSKPRRTSGLTLERRYTSNERKPFDELVWERRSSMISNPVRRPSVAAGIGSARPGALPCSFLRTSAPAGTCAWMRASESCRC